MTRREVVKQIKLLDKELDKWYWVLDNSNGNKELIKFCEEQIERISNKQWDLIGKDEE